MPVTDSSKPEVKKIRKKPLLRRILVRLPGLIGIHFFNLYYAEKNLTGKIETIETSILIEVIKATKEDLNQILIKRSGFQIKRYFLRKYFEHVNAAGSICYVAKSQNKITGYIWVNQRIINCNKMHIMDLPDNGSFTHGGYMFPEYRRNNIFQSLLCFVYNNMKNKGCIFTGAFIDKYNYPSIAVRKCFQPKFQNARILKIPGIKPIIIGKRFELGTGRGM